MIGDKNGTPNDDEAARCAVSAISVQENPKIPAIAPETMKINRTSASERETDEVGAVNAPRPAMETTIIEIGLTIFASTADCPRIRPPIIPRVEPTAPGTRTEASLMSSNASSIKTNSTTSGNGTTSRLASMASSKSVGSISG